MLYTNPLPPGKEQIIYSYALNQESGGDVLSKTVDYDTGQIGGRKYLVLSKLSGLSRGMTFDRKGRNI